MTPILVTGVGGGVGQSIVKSLQGTIYSLVGADGEVLAAGLYAVPRAYRIPYARHPEFVESLLAIAKAEGCRLLLPGLDAELPVLARHRDQFAAAGVTAVVSDPGVIDLCDDKLATAEFLSSHGFPAPATAILANASDVPFPVVLKPRRGGARSQGVHVVRTAEELSSRAAALNADNYVAQECIDGEEFTCGSVTLGGECQGVIVIRRVLRDGDTYKAFVVRDPAIESHVRRVVEALRPFGACNLQLRVSGGVPYVFEINARCSGTTYCRTLAGFNEPLMIADYVLGGAKPHFAVRELSILRYWKELVVDNREIARVQAHGHRVGGGVSL
jgi:carbamoyl-phosphate synthase large subunit